jgi:hypothetical protein
MVLCSFDLQWLQMDRETSTSYDVLERMLLDESAEPTSLPLSLLQYITNHFSLDNEIGRGGFAVVYKVAHTRSNQLLQS